MSPGGPRAPSPGALARRPLSPPRLPASLCIPLLSLLSLLSLLISGRERRRLDDHLGVRHQLVDRAARDDIVEAAWTIRRAEDGRASDAPGLHRSSQKWLSAHSLPHG